MSFNLEELEKIDQAISGLFRGSLREIVADSLASLAPKILHAISMPEEQSKEELVKLMNFYTATRKAAVL